MKLMNERITEASEYHLQKHWNNLNRNSCSSDVRTHFAATHYLIQLLNIIYTFSSKDNINIIVTNKKEHIKK